MKAPTSAGYKATRNILRENNLVTVCEEAGCPNVGECWSQGHATMMIMGEVCTRACSFCNIATGKPPDALDVFEPGRVADAVAKLGLQHVVITSVDRDDIADARGRTLCPNNSGGAAPEPLNNNRNSYARLLKCDPKVLETVVEARPDVFNHNLETVAPAFIPRCAPAPVISIRFVCCRGSRN